MGRYLFLKRMWRRMANGKFYHLGLGSKKYPLHFLIPHGAFRVENLPTLKHNDLLSWFEDCSEGKVEGIVWHCGDGCLIKVRTQTWRSDSLDRLYSFWHAVSIIPYSSYGLKQNWVDGRGQTALYTVVVFSRALAIRDVLWSYGANAFPSWGFLGPTVFSETFGAYFHSALSVLT